MLATGAVRAGYLALAAFILIGPGLGQVAGLKSPAIRTWKMYSGVGVGVLRGVFVVTRDGAEIARETPLQVLGLARYPGGEHYDFAARVLAPGDLERLAAPRCAALGPGEVLAYRGEVGGLDGWEPLAADDLCGGAR